MESCGTAVAPPARRFQWRGASQMARLFRRAARLLFRPGDEDDLLSRDRVDEGPDRVPEDGEERRHVEREDRVQPLRVVALQDVQRRAARPHGHGVAQAPALKVDDSHQLAVGRPVDRPAAPIFFI